MTDYGVQPTGFVRKPIAVILAEIEAALITEFGPGLIQTSQSPMGQINGLFADYAAQLWEENENVYQSYDPDQAEGLRLDTLARLRLLERGLNESDTDFRKAITNVGRARVDLQDLSRSIRGLDGVTYTQVFVNDTTVTDANGMPPNTVAVAVIGGDENLITTTMRQYIVPGISTYGNVSVSTNIEGFCRQFQIVRPITVAVKLNVQVRTRTDAFGCPPPSTGAIEAAILEQLNLLNGDDVTWFKIRSLVEALFPTVEVVSINGARDDAEVEPSSINLPVPIDFLEIATFTADDMTVIVVD